MIRTKHLFSLNHSLAGTYLSGFEYPWQALEGIAGLIRRLGPQLGEDYLEVSPEIWVHKTASIAPSAFLGGPCIIGARTEVRHCAFIRESALVGEGCVVGNSVELKNVILFDHVEVGCNSVLNPGTVVCPGSNIYPLSCVRGAVPGNSIWKTGGVIVKKK